MLGQPQPSLEIRARLDFLLGLVRAAPVEGVLSSVARAELAARLDQHICHNTLKDTLRRWHFLCPLVMRDQRVRLQSHLVVEILAQQHRSAILTYAAEQEGRRL
jgi:hypothetical protein